ncbi:kinase-like protein [Hesseltinella vesiculosa]|uniref:Kinase-like protein n=1 Tax=Hesseltinella vesiculosa TaxID=101127 RepID=A0A1X2GV63_9FUNG|nr:kinase-like protein [Hesseltinella vesiculosa]
MVLSGHSLVPWKSAESLSQHGSPLTQPRTVLTTNTIFKDYDPVTGNKIINQKYMIIREIGRGVHGKVKLAQCLDTQELVAIKIVDKRLRKRQMSHAFLRPSQQQVPTSIDEENERKIRREIAILKKCAHPHVVQLKEIMEDPKATKSIWVSPLVFRPWLISLLTVLEYMDGGEIEWRDENEDPILGLEDARGIFRDVVSGLDYLHYQGVIHRDIKPANLLYSKDHVVKISDFGVSYFNKVLAGDEASVNASQRSDQVDRELAETAGTPAFFAPELCWAGDSRQDYRHRITRAIDVWALGVTLYCFVFGRCPFLAATEYELFEVIPTQPLLFPHAIDSDLKDLLERLLDKDPQKRITLEQVKHHPWVLQDLARPDAWLDEADPRRYQAVCVTDEEVSHAYTMMDRLRKSIHKLSNSFSHLTHNLTRRRAKSTSQPHHPKRSFHTQPPLIETPMNGPVGGSRSIATLTSSPAYPAPTDPCHPLNRSEPHLQDHPPYFDPHSSNDDDLDDTTSDDAQDRPDYQRHNSTASSMSGLVISSRHRQSPPPPLPIAQDR